MAILRLFSLLCFLAALMLLGADAVSSLETGGGIVMRSIDHVLRLWGASPKDWIEMNLPIDVAAAFSAALAWPAWVPLAALGSILALVSMRPRVNSEA